MLFGDGSRHARSVSNNYTLIKNPHNHVGITSMEVAELEAHSLVPSSVEHLFVIDGSGDFLLT